MDFWACDNLGRNGALVAEVGGQAFHVCTETAPPADRSTFCLRAMAAGQHHIGHFLIALACGGAATAFVRPGVGLVLAVKLGGMESKAGEQMGEQMAFCF